MREFIYPQDYAGAVRLWQSMEKGVRVGRSDTPEEIEKKLRRDPDLFLVAEAGSAIIGTVIGGYDGRRGMIYHLAVVDEYRQHGIGAALMDEVELRLKAKGCLKSYLLVVDGNDHAYRFYKKRGWQEMDVTILGKEL